MRAGRFAFAFCLALFMLFAAVPAFAQGDASLSVNAQKEADGGVKAEVSLTSDTPVAGLQFTVAYDYSLLKLDAAESGTLAGGSYTINSNEEGFVHVVWYGAGGDGQPVEGVSSVLSLSFTPKGDGSAQIALRDDGQENKTLIVNSDLEELNSATPDTASMSASVDVTVPGAPESGSASGGAASHTEGVSSQPYYGYYTTTPLPVPTPALYAQAQLQTPAPTQAQPQTAAPAAAQEEEAPSMGGNAPAAGGMADSSPIYTPLPGESIAPASAHVLADKETQSAMAVTDGADAQALPPEVEVLANGPDGTGKAGGFLRPLLIVLLIAAVLGLFFIWFFKLRKEREP